VSDHVQTWVQVSSDVTYAMRNEPLPQ